jgi:hypothetical protein
MQPVGMHESLFGRRYKAQTSTHYQTATLRIKHRGRLEWEGVQLGSGFDVELHYTRKIIVPGALIGLDDDCDLTPALARFLTLNERLVPERLAHLDGVLARYRAHHIRECEAKARALSYRFLALVYNRPVEVGGLGRRAAEDEDDERSRGLLLGRESRHSFVAAWERLEQVSTSEVATWWYIFWVRAVLPAVCGCADCARAGRSMAAEPCRHQADAAARA